MPAMTPIRLAMPTRAGVVSTPARMRGAASTATGSRPSECRASICSDTSMVPSSAVMRAPTRPMSTTAVSTGPSSRITLEVTPLPSTQRGMPPVTWQTPVRSVTLHERDAARELVAALLRGHDARERARDHHDGQALQAHGVALVQEVAEGHL